jgi:predicted DNA-binding mobile mystery protein A
MYRTRRGDGFRELGRQALDRRLRSVPADVFARPGGGWIKAIREALGMTGAELANRMGLTARRIRAIEAEETTGSMKLSTLQRAAEALDCTFVYAFVPNRPLDELVRTQARRKAARLVRDVSHQMRLEQQALEPDAEANEVERLAAQLVDRLGLWSD